MADLFAVYFDTNPLRAAAWPRTSAALNRLDDLVRYFDLTMFLPDTVEIELEEMWLRDFANKQSTANAELAKLRTHAGAIGNVRAELAADTVDDLRAAYR